VLYTFVILIMHLLATIKVIKDSRMFYILILKNIFCSSNKPTNASAIISVKVSFS
jgi:type IV secretory pathway VirB3-like protein